MKEILNYSLFFIVLTNSLWGQSIDDGFSKRKMKKDLEVFKDIRLKANSGLYSYRSKTQIDSIYNWAENEIDKSTTYRDFYNIICQLTDFEGSLHNGTYFTNKFLKSIKNETEGYFPLPLKIIEDNLIVNIEGKKIPLGSRIISINGSTKEELLGELGKYYTTDGFNITGKKVGIDKHFSKYYRFNFGLKQEFVVVFEDAELKVEQRIILKSVSNREYYENFNIRHSIDFDRQLYEETEVNDYYSLKKIDSNIAVLTVNTFSLGGSKEKDHLKYKSFLDSVFVDLNQNDYGNLIIDIRNNGGGNPPNDMITLSYLAETSQKEIQMAWIGFTGSIPYWRYLQLNIPFYLKPFAKGKLNKIMEKKLPIVKNGRRYYSDILLYEPNENRFKGQVYLLVAPPVASAASLFASMVASNTDAILVGEETSGGYYGHNGAFPIEYKLPKSNFITEFSIVNLTQDVKKTENQYFGSGVVPNYNVSQSFDDFLRNRDSQMNYVLELIKKNINY